MQRFRAQDAKIAVLDATLQAMTLSAATERTKAIDGVRVEFYDRIDALGDQIGKRLTAQDEHMDRHFVEMRSELRRIAGVRSDQ